MVPPNAFRRLRFAVVVLVSQLLLVALAISWIVHMVIVAINGQVYFVEGNTVILWLEITVSSLICLFSVTVFVMQLRRLKERRREDESFDRLP